MLKWPGAHAAAGAGDTAFNWAFPTPPMNPFVLGDRLTVEEDIEDIVSLSYGGSISEVTKCIARGDNINKISNKQGRTRHSIVPSGITALIAAVIGNHLDVARLLLENGANIVIESYSDCGAGVMTPLIVAVTHRNFSDEMLDLLRLHHANIDYQNEMGTTALMYTCENGRVAGTKCLVTKGANVALTDKSHYDALMYACARDDVETIDFLLHNGALVTPHCFLLAVLRGDLQVVQRLIAIIDKKCIDCQVDNLLINKHAINRRVPRGGLLIGQPRDHEHQLALLGDTALIIAVRKNFGEIMSLLIDAGANANLQNSLGLNALDTSAEGFDAFPIEKLLSVGAVLSTPTGKSRVNLSGELLLNAVEYRRLDAMRFYLSHGGDVNYMQSGTQDSALSIACKKNYPDLINLLLQFNAIITARVLQKAVTGGHVTVINRLIKAGVDVNQQYDYGKTALMQATFEGRVRIVQALIAAEAKLEMKNEFNMTALHMSFRYNNFRLTQLLVIAGADVNAANGNGEIPLMEALFNNNVAVVNTLIERGSDINKQNYDGSTALMIAVLQQCNLNIIETLVAHGADVNYLNDIGETALIMAARQSNYSNYAAKLASALIQAAGFACINAQDLEGNTACILASSMDNFELVKLLLLNNADAMVGVADQSRLFSGLSETVKPRALEIHRIESNWRNRKNFVTFLVQNYYLPSERNKDVPYVERKYENLLSNPNLVRVITSYL